MEGRGRAERGQPLRGSAAAAVRLACTGLPCRAGAEEPAGGVGAGAVEGAGGAWTAGAAAGVCGGGSEGRAREAGQGGVWSEEGSGGGPAGECGS